MYIHFSHQGATYKAAFSKHDENKILVSLFDENLVKEFGASLQFYINNNNIEFNCYNRSHSDLFALHCSISKAIKDHFPELK